MTFMSGHSMSATRNMQSITICRMIGSLATKPVPLLGFSGKEGGKRPSEVKIKTYQRAG